MNLKDMTIAALVNTSSGRTNPRVAQALDTTLADLGLKPARWWAGPGRDLEAELEGALAARPDVLLVLGGDGTIRAAAEACGPGGPLLIPLPGGTMNMLPHAIYGTHDWRRTLREVTARPSVRTVHGAQAEGRRFFVGAMFGGPSHFSEPREAARAADVRGVVRAGASAVKAALDRELICRFGACDEASGEAVGVRTPLSAPPSPSGEICLGVAVIDLEGTLDALRLALSSLFEPLRDPLTVRREQVGSFDLISTAPIPALLDGEPFTFGPTLTVEVVPDAFRALVPG